MVQVDNLGNVIAAAYGHVPFRHGPRQTAKDGEDYAVLILTQCAMAPFELYADCQGTLDMLQGGQGLGASAGGPRAHLWAPFWSSFDSTDFSAYKTAAHCSFADVHNGKTTMWEKKANDSADHYAKIGAAKHAAREADVD